MPNVWENALAMLRGGKTKKEGGVDFPAEAYAYVPDPEQPSTWKLRLWASPSEKETSRQVGMALAALGPGFRGNKVEIPSGDLAAVKRKVRAAWRKAHKGETGKVPSALLAQFSADPIGVEAALPEWANFADVPEDDPNAEYVLRTGPIMKTGDYSDKGLGVVTVEDLARQAETFSPADMDLQHLSDIVPTVLDGKLGALVAVHHDAEAQPDTLYGTVLVPKWLDGQLASPEQRQVSTTWHIPTRTIEKMAWVVEPRVQGARLEEAYAEFAKQHNTYSGQRAVQRVHDLTAEAGAVCKKPTGDAAKMQSAHERDALQSMHDLAIQHGATCDNQVVRTASSAPSYPYSYYGGLSMAAPSVAADQGKEGDSNMDAKALLAKLTAILAEEEGNQPAPPAPPEPQQPQPAPTPAVQPAVATLTAGQPTTDTMTVAERAHLAETERLRAELFDAKLRQSTADATAFVNKYVGLGKLFPGEAGFISDLYVQLATDDAQRQPTVARLSNGEYAKSGAESRLGMLTAWLEAAPAHQIAREQLAEGAQRFFTVANPGGPVGNDDERPPTDEEIASLIGKTPIGRAVIDHRDGVKRAS